MSDSGTSIFDLSPSEKLQLVEDLWDDLAGTPEAVPVHDWQKQELARRKSKSGEQPGFGAFLGRGEAKSPRPVCRLS